GLPGAWARTMAGIEACKRTGLQFQIHFSVSPMNYREVPEMVAFTHKLGARVLNLFFLVCTGRGEEMTAITPPQYEEVLTYLVDVQQQYPDMLLRARCAPHCRRIAYERDANSPVTKANGYMRGGRLAAPPSTATGWTRTSGASTPRRAAPRSRSTRSAWTPPRRSSGCVGPTRPRPASSASPTSCRRWSRRAWRPRPVSAGCR